MLFKDIIEQNLSRIPMIFGENAIMLNAMGAWKNANNLKKQFSGSTKLEFVL